MMLSASREEPVVLECGDASAADFSEDAVELSPNSLGESEGLISIRLDGV